jgi:hypothetical protein
VKRVFAIDVLECPGCGSRLQTTASVMPAPLRRVAKTSHPLGMPECLYEQAKAGSLHAAAMKNTLKMLLQGMERMVR